MKIGSRKRIDSFMPRRFKYKSNSVSSTSMPSLALLNATGRRENSASTPLDTEMETVSM